MNVAPARRRPRRGACLLLAAGCAALRGGPVLAGDPPPSAPAPARSPATAVEDEAAEVTAVVDGVYAAQRAHDRVALDRWARRPVDPVWVAARFHNRLLDAAHAATAPGDDTRAAAQAYAAAVGDLPTGRAAAAWIASWASLTPTELASLRDLQGAVERARTARDGGQTDAVLALDAPWRRAVESLRSKDAADLAFEVGAAHMERLHVVDAFEAFLRSARAARRIPWPVGAARAAAAAAEAAFDAGRTGEGLEIVTVAIRELEGAGFDDRSAPARISRAQLLVHLARYQEAYEEASRAWALADAVGDSRTASVADLSRGAALEGLGRPAEARVAFARALDVVRRTTRPDVAARVLMEIARGHTDHDRASEALACYEAARALVPERNRLRAWLLTSMGGVYRRMGRDARAQELHEEAIDIARETGDRRILALAKGNLANAWVEQGRVEEGIAALREVLRTKEELREAAESVADSRTALARALRIAGRPEEAVPLLARAHEEFLRAGSLPRAAATTTQRALAEEAQGHLDAAYAAYREAAADLERIGDESRATTDAYAGLARVCLRQGKGEEAVEASRRSAEGTLRIAAELGETDAEALLQLAKSVADRGVEAAWTLVERDPKRAAEAAYGFVESSRAVLLSCGLVHGRALLAAEVAPDVLADEAARRSVETAARAALLQAAIRRDDGATARARAAYDAATAAHRESIARLEREARRLAGVVRPRTASPDDVRAALAPDQALVLYHGTEASLFAVVLTKDAMSLLRLGDGPSIRRDVEAWLGQVATQGADDAPAARRLGAALLDPVDRVAKRPERLLVSPDGALAFLPFAALEVERDGRPVRAVLVHDVVLVPSATVLGEIAKEAGAAHGRGLVAVGDPDYAGASALGLPPLPGSAAEVADVAALFPANERTVLVQGAATPERLLAALSLPRTRLRAIHVAAHAFMDPDQPRRSAFALSGGSALDLDAIYRLRTSADVAVLSACSTGQGKLLHGEGVLGFARGFFLAGVPRVVVSQWVVSDESSRALMHRFYEGLVTRDLPASAALRAAQRAQLEAGGPWAHPFHWAAFTLWGAAN